MALVFTTFWTSNLKFCCIVLRALEQVQMLVFTTLRASNLEMIYVVLRALEQSSSVGIYYVQGLKFGNLLKRFTCVTTEVKR